jgi:hypothetical protein
MAKAKTSALTSFVRRGKKSRPGVKAKTRTSNHKSSKNYVKKYRGQGR